MKRFPLHTRILAGMIIGITAGLILKSFVSDEAEIKEYISYVKPIGDIFLNFIFMMIIPLIITALALGVAELGDVSKLGRIGFKMFKYTLVVTTISVALGIGIVNIVQPGNSLRTEDREMLTHKYGKESENLAAFTKAPKKSTGEMLTQLIPKNPLMDMVHAFDKTYAGGGLLAVMVFALILGIAMSKADPDKIATFKSFLEGLYEITMKVIGFAMQLAPFGIAALLFSLTADLGTHILLVLLRYVAVVIGALAIHLFVTYSIILKFFAGMSPVRFFRDIKEVMVTAFSTSSSNASLPVAIKVTIEKLGLPKDITHFILTIGSTANQNGTALYEGITILFLAQCFGVDLSLWAQLKVVAICILAGIGTAGVPGGSLPVLMVILISIGVPGESIALIIGVDRILDMSRTVLNVTGDITATVYINHQEEKRALREASVKC